VGGPPFKYAKIVTAYFPRICQRIFWHGMLLLHHWWNDKTETTMLKKPADTSSRTRSKPDRGRLIAVRVSDALFESLNADARECDLSFPEVVRIRLKTGFIPELKHNTSAA
jgi:hypothetical protein